jgi:hypothetical protein
LPHATPAELNSFQLIVDQKSKSEKIGGCRESSVRLLVELETGLTAPAIDGLEPSHLRPLIKNRFRPFPIRPPGFPELRADATET